MSSKFTEEELEQIGAYLAEKYPVLKSSQDIYRYSDIKIDIYERIVRVEEELKHQRELIHEVLKMMDKRFEEMRSDMDRRFDQVDKRFEQVDKRFEQIDKRFEQVDKRFEDTRTDMNTRFEEMRTDMNARFEEMRIDMNARFEQVDKRFNMMMWFMGIGFTLITTIITGAFVLLK